MANINQVQLPDGTQYDIATSASKSSYINTTSGLSATNSQDAIDEIVGDWAKQIATREGATASKAYSVGEWIIDADGYTGQVTTAVASGATWTEGTNYTRKPISEGLKSESYRTQYFTMSSTDLNTITFTLRNSEAYIVHVMPYTTGGNGKGAAFMVATNSSGEIIKTDLITAVDYTIDTSQARALKITRASNYVTRILITTFRNPLTIAYTMS